MIQFTDGDYILGLWFAYDDQENNWLMMLKKDGEGWKGCYRFRYIKDDKVWDSDDVKNWYDVRIHSGSEEEILIRQEAMLAFIKLKFPKTDKLIVQGDVNKFLELAKTKEWMHLKTEVIH